MKKLVVNKDACIACGACVGIDEAHFDFDDEGFSEAISQENLDSDLLQNAIESCPTSAISLEECDCHCGDDCECGDDCKCSKENKCSDDCDCGE